jgi:ATP-dependent DNA helicase RecQ
VVRQLLAAGLLAVEGDYGTLVLTDRSADVLRGSVPVMLRREPERRRPPRPSRPGVGSSAPSEGPGAGRRHSEAPAADLPPEAQPVFERLRAWRTAVAREQKVPPYVIFHDATLRAIAALRPATLAELGTVSGVGQTKLARFGQGVLDALAEPA